MLEGTLACLAVVFGSGLLIRFRGIARLLDVDTHAVPEQLGTDFFEGFAAACESLRGETIGGAQTDVLIAALQ